ncbi:ANTH-domain-containing protein [Dacryopinax primogenitus]|uniref:ANTH-domain-containing protein n=1 Tax=Dacryopinax primogenitus (strain DJM 731) TaxID=1858805 RepID=M5G298_DACPD|nr:ANTH-domain-containing protein [Dacryopinax primogenitus]EJT99996.1 ANTH-domain-containing protein [Dacryopinax primogenitus]
MSFFGRSQREPQSDFLDEREYDDYGSPAEARATRYGAGTASTVHYPTRPVDKDKAEAELAITIKKATNGDETAPKQKHVRRCIVYTWDYHSSQSLWAGLRVQPILSDEVQTFKSLILVHKVLQEGHPIVLKEAQNQTGWLETCARTVGNDGQKGYGSLIRAYVSFILAKLRFHRVHPDFNGLFEYEEYISLKGIDDPNEGYETITDLMNLQDQIENFQKLIFSHFRGSTNNECRISALVPLVKESYGIYRFITSMLRAMHRRTGDMEALEPLRQRYNAQHYALRKFYYECSNLKYLTGLINVPKLGQEPPNLMDSGVAPDLPARPKDAGAPSGNGFAAPKSPPAAPSPAPDQAMIAEQARMLKEYEDKQAALQQQRSAEEQKIKEQQAREAREFSERQAEQAEREKREREVLENQQRQWAEQQQMWGQQQAAQRVNELERELLGMRGQFERDQMMLEQYDRRVKALEGELSVISNNAGSQIQGKDELIKQLQDQVTLWRNKYEALAKLYSQLRSEHLDMLSKFKALQLKANSAQEAIDKMERMERDIKAKNLELADMIRERDRARFDLDRSKSSQKEELDRIRRELSFANERAEDASRTKSSEVSSMLSKYNRQLTELEDSLRAKQIQIDDLLHRIDEKDAEVERVKQEKEEEIAVLQEGIDQQLQTVADVQQNQGLTDQAYTAQIDTLILDNRKKMNDIIDSILQACVQKVDDAIYELESPSGAGNQTTTPEYTLSLIEKAANNASEFATVFTLYIDGEHGGDHVDVIKGANEFAQSLADVLFNTKGVTRLVNDDDASDRIVNVAKAAGDMGLRFFLNVQSYKLDLMQPQKRKEAVMLNNGQARSALQKLSEALDAIVPKAKAPRPTNGDIGDVVEQEMLSAARTIEAATQRLQELMARPKDPRFSGFDVQVHDSILSAAMAITSAIGRLIKAATESQQEIVAQGRGSSTSQQFYKRNNRWTEGLISAAKAVAFATNLLIETADGLLSGTHSLEQLIVASNEVAAATAQLVAASRVKASLMSKTQERLELAARAVTEACKALVKQVKAISAKKLDEESVDYSKMAVHEFKVAEMEQQVEILKLEKDLTAARHRLGAMRRAGYHTEETD